LAISYPFQNIPDKLRERLNASALRKCINSDLSNSWERCHFYDPDAASRYIKEGIEKKLEDRQKDYQDNE
jgi:hypothetical protein